MGLVTLCQFAKSKKTAFGIYKRYACFCKNQDKHPYFFYIFIRILIKINLMVVLMVVHFPVLQF